MVTLLLLASCTTAQETEAPESAEQMEPLRQEGEANAPGPREDPVIFEPLTSVHLTRSTYKVTSYVDFRPHLQAFHQFSNYLTQYIKDLDSLSLQRHIAMVDNTPNRVEKELSVPSETKVRNEAPRRALQTCRRINSMSKDMYSCHLTRALTKFRSESVYQWEVFRRIWNRFYAAIDHFDKDALDHRDPPEERGKRPKRAFYPPPRPNLFMDVNRDEIEFLNGLVETFRASHPEVIQARQKRFGPLTFLMGWGLWSNARSIKKLKKNVQILRDQNVLQDKQIREVAHYLNLTTLEVIEHRRILTALDYRTQQLNATLIQIYWAMGNQRYVVSLLLELLSVSNQLTLGMEALNANVDRLYEYMRVMATHEVNPMIINPRDLRKTLKRAENKVRSIDPRLRLPIDPDESIWSYYPLIRITPIVENDFLVVLMTIPLIDRSFELKVYKVHNLPAMEQGGRVTFNYELEGSYLAVTETQNYVALPSESEVHMCLVTKGHLCTLKTALYPTEDNTWCVYALFKNDREKILQNCKGKMTQPLVNRAVSLGGYLWAISTTKRERLYLRCLDTTRDLIIEPPLHITKIPSGCEALGNHLLIPARNDIQEKYEADARTEYFLGFNMQYQNLTRFGVWNEISPKLLSVDQMNEAALKFTQTAVSLPLTLWKDKLSEIDTRYPWSIPTQYLLIGLIAMGALMLGWFIWYVLRWRGMTTRVNEISEHIPLLKKLMPKLIDSTPVSASKTKKENPPDLPAKKTHSVRFNPKTEEIQTIVEAATPLEIPSQSYSKHTAKIPLDPSPLAKAKAVHTLEAKGVDVVECYNTIVHRDKV